MIVTTIMTMMTSVLFASASCAPVTDYYWRVFRDILRPYYTYSEFD